MIQPERVHVLNDKPEKGQSYVLYWMQSAQRVDENHALAFAINKANELHVPLYLCFILSPHYPESYQRHYYFLLDGLREISDRLVHMGIPIHMFVGDPVEEIEKLCVNASCLVTDRSYLIVHRQRKQVIAQKIPCAMYEIETNIIVPVEVASQHEEYAARTLRPKINNKMLDFLQPVKIPQLKVSAFQKRLPKTKIALVTNFNNLLPHVDISPNARLNTYYKGGAMEAEKKLDTFINTKLALYDKLRNQPGADGLSNLSPYLHFGHISPLRIAQRVLQSDFSAEQKNIFLDELIIRRELAINFIWYNEKHDTFACLPEWAQKTLHEHASDKREYNYSYNQLEEAETHDIYWNAAQREMLQTGKMHSYMRMYWCKKIIEWVADPEDAFAYALQLNNTYELDARDASGCAGVAWCFGKHDRPWVNKPIYGTVRMMTSGGLERKFDMKPYLTRFARL